MPRAEEYGSSSGSMGVTSVTASLPLNSSGGSTPNISLSGVVGVANGGTGSATGSAASLNNLPAAELVGNVPVGTLSVALSTPPAIGGTTPAAITGTTITATSQFSGSGAGLTGLPGAQITGNVPVAAITQALTTPPAIGGTTPAAGTFTVLVGTSRIETPTVGTSAATQHALPSGTGDLVSTDATQGLSNKSLGSNLAAGGFKVTGLGTPTAASSDAATAAYAEAQKTGSIVTLATAPTNATWAFGEYIGITSLVTGSNNSPTTITAWCAPVAGTLKKFRLQSTIDSSVALTFGVYKGNDGVSYAATAVSMVLAPSSLSATDLSTSVSVAAGDCILISGDASNDFVIPAGYSATVVAQFVPT